MLSDLATTSFKIRSQLLTFINNATLVPTIVPTPLVTMTKIAIQPPSPVARTVNAMVTMTTAAAAAATAVQVIAEVDLRGTINISNDKWREINIRVICKANEVTASRNPCRTTVVQCLTTMAGNMTGILFRVRGVLAIIGFTRLGIF